MSTRVALRFLPLLALAAALAACATLRVGSDYDHTATFGSYHRFALLPGQTRRDTNPVATQRARDAVQSDLTAKGYALVDDPADADFVVDVTIGAHDRVDFHSYPAPYGGPWYWYRPGWWGYPYWGGGLDVHTVHEGTLSVDVFDARTHRPIWHGWAKKDLSRADIDHPGGPIQEAVTAVLARFPPG